MSHDIQDIEERLKALLSKADKLFNRSPPQDEAVLSDANPGASAPHKITEDIPDMIPGSVLEVPEKKKAPLLLQAPAFKTLLDPSPQALDDNLLVPPVPDSADASLRRGDVVEPAFTGVVPNITETPQEEAEIPFLIGYPEPHLEAAKELQENLERLKPKFTKMKFHLRGRGSVPYSRDHPLKQTSFCQIQDLQGGVLLLITPHRLSSRTPHPLAAELARRGLHFQEVLLDSIAKKAFYFDFLLGLVFFLKTQKTPPAGADPEPPDDEGDIEWIGPGKRV